MDHYGKITRKRNPRERANLLSKYTFAYTLGIFKKGFKNDLQDDDLYEVIKSCGSKKNGDRIENKFQLAKKSHETSILQVAWECFGYRYLILCFVYLTYKLITSILQPFAMGKLISYFAPNQKTMTKNDAILYAGMVIGLRVLSCLFLQNYFLVLQELAIRIRVSFSSLIYRKALKLTPTALSRISIGNVITLITKDVATYQTSLWILNELFVVAIPNSILCYMVYRQMGISSLLGLAILFSIIPIQVCLTKKVTSLRLNLNKKTDERLQITQEVLSAIRIIKMYTWEKFFGDELTAARKVEMNAMLGAYYIKMAVVIIGVLCTRIGFYTLIMSYIWMGYTITAEQIFNVMGYFEILKMDVGVLIPLALNRFGELYAVTQRINLVLQGEELPKSSNCKFIPKNPKINVKNVTVSVKGAKILRNVSMVINSGLTLITGPVGSGKTSLLKTILHDHVLDFGELYVEGKMSYSSQDPWLFPSTIRQNILFGEDYDEQRYKDIIRVCALQYDLSLFDKGDQTIVADRGLNLSRGQQARINLARAIYRKADIYLLDDSLTALDAHVQEHIFKECIRKYLKAKMCIFVTHNPIHIINADRVVILDQGRVSFFGTPSEINEEEVIELLKDDEIEETEEIEQGETASDEKSGLLETEQVTCKKRTYQEVKKQGRVNWDVYGRYFKFAGGIIPSFVLLLFFVGFQSSENFSTKLLMSWVNLQQNLTDLKLDNQTDAPVFEEAMVKNDRTIKFYSILIVVSCTLDLVKNYALISFCRRASINIHKKMSTTIINCVMSFFDSYFIGNILNRFSQDLNIIDEQLPFVFTECFRVVFSGVGMTILILSVTWQFSVPAAVFFLIIILLRVVYMPSGRSMKRLEAANRSPLVGHLNSTFEGITTIRAYKAQQILKDEFDRHQDLHTSANFTSFCLMRGFGFFMNSVCVIFVTAIVAKLVFTDSGSSAGEAGLAITQAVALAETVQWGVRQWSELENIMTSVERVLEYTVLPQENPTGQILANWPNKGEIEFKDVSLTYSNNEKVLKNINFSVGPSQKIGIVGRTGAGKSSIISTLFRLYNFEGKVIIDDVNIKILTPKFLRQSIAIIPQDPLLFTGTLRTNIDPLGKYTDEEIWQAIERVKLKDTVDSLNFAIHENGSNFSSGQKQLICLARAMIRKNKIVVLDEATANMDAQTDIMLQSTIKENFTGCTVFTIAHRLHSVLDCNKVMVLSRGEIIEYDDPLKLLSNKNGEFFKMVKQAGLLHLSP